MTSRRLGQSALLALALLVLFNGLVFVLTRFTGREQLTRGLRSHPQTRLLFLGNSLIQAGIDTAAFARG